MPETNKSGRLEGITWTKEDIVILDIRYSEEKDDWDVLNENDDITRVKPLLRRLSDMTEEEATTYLLKDPSMADVQDFEIMEIKADYIKFSTGKLRQGNGFIYEAEEGLPITWHTSEQFHYLLSKSFDLWGLIDANLAIDAKTLQP